MVNLEKRQIAKRLIERFLACEITNDGFDDAFPRDQGDPALDAIYSNLWAYYSENQERDRGREEKRPFIVEDFHRLP